jgi:hypothetical protein
LNRKKGILVHWKGISLLAVTLWSAAAQTREIGFLGGGGIMRGVAIQGAPAGISAGLQPGLAGGVLFGQDLYRHWGGEIRYLFEQRNLRISSGNVSSSFSGQAHVVHYDLVYYPGSRESAVRPYLAAGGGMKLFYGAGTETSYRPLMEYAYLTRTHELKPLATIGGGVRIALSRRMWLRIDVRDQMTPFPTRVIAPAPGMSISGWLHDFVPTVGMSWRF